MLTYHKQIDKRTTMKNQNRSAALGRPAMKLLGASTSFLVFGRPTPVKKVWDMIRKVSGKNKKSECVHIKSSNGNTCYSTKDISNALGGKILLVPITANSFRI